MPGKILLVDDDPVLTETTKEALEINDYTVAVAGDGEAALRIAKAEKPGLILMDYTLPGGMNGYQACQAIKNDPQTSGIPVVLLTGRDKSDIESHDSQSPGKGPDAYIKKPYDMAKLIETCEKLIRPPGAL